MNDLERAIDIAVDAYAGQTDKAGETYIRHPLRVMQAMSTDRERVVALLHDIVEDSEYTLDEIEQEFSAEVRDAVDALTKREGEPYQEFVERAGEIPTARRVKIADIEDNMDLTRLDEVSESSLERQRKYHRAWSHLRAIDDSSRSP